MQMWTCFVLHLSASSTPPSSNQNSTRATLPSIYHIKTTNWDQKAALPTASNTLTGAVNGWPKKNSGHRTYLTESLVRITGVRCFSVASVWLQEWFDQRSAMPRVTSILNCRSGLATAVTFCHQLPHKQQQHLCFGVPPSQCTVKKLNNR